MQSEAPKEAYYYPDTDIYQGSQPRKQQPDCQQYKSDVYHDFSTSNKKKEITNVCFNTNNYYAIAMP